MKNLLISITVSSFLILGAFNIPSEYLNLGQLFQSDNVGIVALTDITGSTAVSAYPTIQNANNTSLETAINTIEGTTTNSTITTLSGLTTATALASVGTITTGTWTSTDVGVAYGGTGTSTVTSGAVLYGNGTGSFLSVGPCTDNQVIAYTTSVPLCTTQTVDETADYAWTGAHNFTSNFRVIDFRASSTAANPMYLNGIDYNTPSVDGASSTVFMTDGAGQLTSYRPDWHLIGSVDASAVTNATATFAAAESLMIVWSYTACATGCSPNIEFNGLADANYGSHTSVDNAAFTDASDANLMALGGSGDTLAKSGVIYVTNTLAERKRVTWTGGGYAAGSSAPVDSVEGSGIWDNTSAQITSVNLNVNAALNLTNLKIRVYGTNN